MELAQNTANLAGQFETRIFASLSDKQTACMKVSTEGSFGDWSAREFSKTERTPKSSRV